MDTGHWTYNKDFNIDEYYGFVYRITNVVSGQEYIGKKCFYNIRRVKVKGRKNRRIVRRVSNWKTYSGSSKWLNLDIDKLGKSNFIFRIVELCKTKGILTFREVESQWDEKVLTTTMENGTKKYYNMQIGSIKFIPAELMKYDKT